MIRYIVVLSFLLSSYLANAQQLKVNARSEYINKIVKERTEKDDEFLKSEKSPIPSEVKTNFPGLDYFPVKPRYKVKARFERYDHPVHFKMKTTTSREPEYAVFGKATFRLKGHKISLNVYQNVELVKKPGYEDYLFIPFSDRTNGIQTYGGGRFIDARVPNGDDLEIDFNSAYNPYCAYNHGYSCPVPPDENKLNISVKAGEKNWNHDH